MEDIVKKGKKMSSLLKRTKIMISFFIVLMFSIGIVACGKKGPPLPQKINQLYSFQDVYVHLNSAGSLTVMGTINGARQNVQALVLEIEGYDENCSTCPFVPAESFAIDPRAVWDSNIPQEFSFTVMPTKQFVAYRWRVVGHNSILGLPTVVTPVLKAQTPIEDNRNFLEIPINMPSE